jgi:hypothetical protein
LLAACKPDTAIIACSGDMLIPGSAERLTISGTEQTEGKF